MEGKPWRQLIGEYVPAEGLTQLFDALESSGWLARRRYGEHSLAFWPDERRRDQISVDMRYPLIEPRLEEYRAHTGATLIDLVDANEEEEGGQR